LGCKHCFYRDYINQEIDELNCEEIEKIFSSFSKKLDNICITGGEPFLRSDLIEICEMLSNKKIAKSITIPTSGYDSNFIAGNILKILKNTNLKLYIQISLDGLETTHDQLRNTPGLFSEAVSLIKRLKQMQNCISNLFVSIMTTVLEYNYIELLALDNFIHREFSNISHDFQFVRYGKDVGGIVDTNLIEASHPYNPIFDSPSIESCREIIRQYENNHKANRIVHWKLLVKKYHLDIVEKKKKILPCLAGKLSVIIYPNGDVSFCEMLKPFANFRDFAYDFQKVWKSDITRQKKPSIRHCFCTYSCAISDAIPYDKNAILKFINHKF
jgi:MoaA/NifB/PqqE/SkfB family radical SAM enzyme